MDTWNVTYVMTFLATEAAGSPDEPSAMVHVLVDVGVFNLDGLAVGHIIESSQHLRTEEQHNAPRHIRFNWVAPDNTTVENEDITNVTFTIATMLTNDDGTPSDDPWAFVNFTYNKFQHNAGDGNNQQTDTTQGNDGDSDGVGQDQDFVKLMEEAEDEFGVTSDCYSWVYWNTHSVDKSLPGWGCPMYEGAASTDEGPSFMNTFLEAMFDGGLGGVLVVGLGGLFLVPFSRDWLEKYTETDETILAARNSFPHMLYGVSFAAGALYTLLFVFFLAIFSFTGEAWDGNRICSTFLRCALTPFSAGFPSLSHH